VQLFLLLVLYATVFGLIVGSYLNVVIYRVPLGISTVTPRSRCPACGAPIPAIDNLPVLSWLLLRGRCRACGNPISARYPLVEAATGLLFAVCLIAFGPAPETAVAALFGCLMIVLALIDFDHLILPDRITWPGIALGLLSRAGLIWIRGLPWAAMRDPIAGVLLGGGLPLAIWAVWYLVRKEEGMGLGDAKMLALIGAFLGWRGALVAFFVAVLAGAVVGVALMIRRGHGLQMRLPFGTFLALGGLVALFAGPEIVAAYARLL
jgi:leader peptidase (prepilin peptidase)/N-methyltransferase